MKLAHVLFAGLLSSLTASPSVHAQTGTADPVATSPAPEGATWSDQNKAAAKRTQAAQPGDAVPTPNAGQPPPTAGKPNADEGDSINTSDSFNQPKKATRLKKESGEGKTDGAAVPAEIPIESAAPVEKPTAESTPKAAVQPPKTPKAPVIKPNSAINTKPAMPQGTATKDPSAADLSDDLRGNPNTSTDATRARTRVRSSDVGLSPEQTNAIIEIRKTSQNDVEKRLTEELRLAKTDMNAAMMDATPADEVRRKFELVQKKYLELQRIKFDRTLKIREVLSIDQRKKLQGLKNSH